MGSTCWPGSVGSCFWGNAFSGPAPFSSWTTKKRFLICGGTTMSPGEVAAIMFGTFIFLIILRVPVAFALGLACLPIFVMDDRLTPILMLGEMTKAYNAFILLAVPFFLLAANIMHAAGITARLVDLTRCMVGQFRGGLAYIHVVVSMIFAGISGSSTAGAAGGGALILPAT